MSWHKRTNNHVYFVLIIMLSVVSFLGSGLAANITVPGSGNAGQGTTISAGYTASVVKYSGSWAGGGNNSNTNVTGFNFVLKTVADGAGTSTVTNDNTVVYTQLVGTTNGDWAQCSVSSVPAAGTVVCSLTGSQQKPMAQVTGVNITAYDADAGPGAAGVPTNPYTALMSSANVTGASSDTTLLEGGDLYRVVTWTSTSGGSITPTSSIDVEYLVVAGGGAGSANGLNGGGGGAGGLLAVTALRHL